MTDTNNSKLRKRPSMLDIVKLKTDMAQRITDEANIHERLARLEVRLSTLEVRIYNYDYSEMYSKQREYEAADTSEEM